jgi:hypothetical protein
MGSLRVLGRAALIAVVVSVAGCENADTQTDVLRSAAAGGNSTHVDQEYARAEFHGNLTDECTLIEALVYLFDRTEMGPGGPTDRQYVWVRLDLENCCDNTETRWTGSADVVTDQHELNLPNNRHHLWSAWLRQTVTVSNTAGQTMAIDLDLSWTGLDDFRHTTQNRHVEGVEVSSYSMTWCPAELDGTAEMEGATFSAVDTQERVRIHHQVNTSHDR